MSNVKLTIGVPVFNGAAGLPGLVHSVSRLGMRANEYEILIVDNNSTDHTDEVVGSLIDAGHPVRYHKNNVNIGRVENWNRVLDLAEGEYVKAVLLPPSPSIPMRTPCSTKSCKSMVAVAFEIWVIEPYFLAFIPPSKPSPKKDTVCALPLKGHR